MKRLYIGKSAIHGRGVFADANIKKGDYIGLLYKDVYAPSGSKLPGVTKLSSFVNHSYEPNGKVERSGARYHLKALEDIDKDEEITIDYKQYMKIRNVHYES